MADAYARRDLEALLTEHGQALVVGAPGIGKSTRFDELAAELPLAVYRDPEDFRESDHDGAVVLDDFYDQFTWYRTANIEDREAYRRAIERQIERDGSLFACTTPYRLQWMLDRHRETFDELLGGLTGDWTVEPVQVDHDDAVSFLCDRLDESVTIEEFQDEIEWRYHFEDSFEECLHEDEQFQDIFGDFTEYRTLVPGILTAAGSDASLRQALSDRESALSSLKWMFKDVSATGAISEGSGLIDGAREYAETLKTTGALEAVKSAVGSVVRDSTSDIPIEKLGLGATGAALSGPALAIGCIGYWAWATRKEDEETRETVRKEFGRMLGSDVLELSAADREDLEAELGLEPKTLLYLNRAASGVTWQKVEQAMADIEAIDENLAATIERVDEVETTVADHDAVIKTLVNRLELIGGVQGYMTVGEFVDELYEYPEYVPPGYRVQGEEPVASEDAVEELLDIIEDEQSSVTTVRGESGIGKSRLFAEVGLRLQDREDIETVYVRDPSEFREPTYAGETVVVFLDEAGRTSETEDFFELTSGGWREYGVDCTVHVVAAYRPVYEREVESLTVPNPAARNELELETLDEARTTELLSDTNVSAETARQIHETTEGNPFLSRLLALEERDTGEDRRTPEEKLEEVIDETMLKEVTDLDADPQAVRELLTVVAVLGEYDVRNDSAPVAELFDNLGEGMLTQHEILTAMRDARYLTAVDTGGSRDTKFTHKIDVFAEYLRHRILTESPLQYDELISQCVDTSGPTIARGLVELRRSSLRRFDFFETETVEQETLTLLEDTARQAIDGNGPISDIISVQMYVSFVAPGGVPYEDLEARYDDSDPGQKTAEELLSFVTVLYQHASRVAEAEDAGVLESDLPMPSLQLYAVAQTWIGHLDCLAKSHPDNDEIHLRLAKALNNATINEGEAGRFEAVQQRLDRLEEMVKAHPDNDEIIEAGTVAHIFGFRVWVDTDRIENASDTIETLSRLSDSFDRLYLGDRGTAVETILKETGENLLRTNRLDLLERLFDALQAGLSEGRVGSVCTDLIMTADELLREDEIDMDTYTRVAKLCQD